ncbi:hypothetical protein AB4Z01_10910 [Inquilinus sp. YAF38]|uniref:hypothetical protein n=1 Tax=Inquilinus sp. YAF38 TaxID=3233084 RepID=UPI003F8DC58F
MAEPLRWESKALLIKTEAAYGTDAAPTAADAMLVTDVEFRPMEGTDEARNLEMPWLGADEELPAGLHAILTFSVELVGSGTAGTAPAWSPIARACGLAEVITAATSVEYRPVSRGHEAVTVHFFIESTKHALIGTRGTAVLQVEAQKIPKLRVTLTGLWRKPTKQAPPAGISFAGFKDPELATSVNTPVYKIDGITMVMRSTNLDLGCDVQGRFLVGSESILIADRGESIAAVVEAMELDVFDPFDAAVERRKVPFLMQHGTDPGFITEVECSKCQVKRLSGYQNNQKIVEWPLSLTPLPTAGNDQFTITLK